MFPLPFSCLHDSYIGSAEDDHGNPVPTWATSVAVDCFWWIGQSTESRYQFRASGNTGSDQASVDLTLVVDANVPVDHRDRFTVDGKAFEVVGLPKDYNHGPFAFSPDRLVVELKWTG